MSRKQGRKAKAIPSRPRAKSSRGNKHVPPKPASATRMGKPPALGALARKGAERTTNGKALSPGRSTGGTDRPGRTVTRGTRQHLMAGFARDRVVLMVRDPYWLHCYWELTHRAIERAEAALGEEWPLARPILRLFDVPAAGKMGAPESVNCDIDIHGGCN